MNISLGRPRALPALLFRQSLNLSKNKGETAMNRFKAVGCAALVSSLAVIGQAVGANNALLKAPLMACPSDKTVIGGVKDWIGCY